MSGSASASGSHGFGGGDEYPAGDAYDTDWTWSAMWNAFPGREGDGSDCDPQVRAEIEAIYRGKTAALIYVENPSSSYHLSIGEFAVVIQLSTEDEERLNYELGHGMFTWSPNHGDMARSFLRRPFNPDRDLNEFIYQDIEHVKRLIADRAELDNAELPGPENYNRPRPGETSEQYWARLTALAQMRAKPKRPIDGD